MHSLHDEREELSLVKVTHRGLTGIDHLPNHQVIYRIKLDSRTSKPPLAHQLAAFPLAEGHLEIERKISSDREGRYQSDIYVCLDDFGVVELAPPRTPFSR
jgi:hypothetical protein